MGGGREAGRQAGQVGNSLESKPGMHVLLHTLPVSRVHFHSVSADSARCILNWARAVHPVPPHKHSVPSISLRCPNPAIQAACGINVGLVQIALHGGSSWQEVVCMIASDSRAPLPAVRSVHRSQQREQQQLECTQYARIVYKEAPSR